MALPPDIAAVLEQVKKQVRMDAEEAGQMTLGSFIVELEKAAPESHVTLDVLGLVPTDLDSYRGFYDHLAIGFKEDGRKKTADLLAEAKSAMGKCFQGYKGGDYYMNEDTPMWVANYGKSGGLRVVGVDHFDLWTTIKTARDAD